MDENHLIILIVFILTYAGIAAGHVRGTGLGRTGITLIGAIAMLAFGGVTSSKAVEYVNFPSILMLFGLFLISAQLRLAGFYSLVARKISAMVDRPGRFLLVLMVVSGLLSAFLNNDIVCAAFTPVVAFALLEKRVNPIPFLIALAVSSNIGCAATLIGNAQDILVGEVAKLSFGGYLMFALPPVLICMAMAYGIIWWMSRNKLSLIGEASPSGGDKPEPVDKGQIIKGLLVVGVLVVLFFTPLPRAVVTLAGAAILLVSRRLTSKKMLSLIDWEVLLLFIGLFVVVGAFEDTGIMQNGITWLKGRGVDINNPYILTAMTGVLSNLINNSAAVMLLVHGVDLTVPLNGYILALANTLGGNLLLIGSVANIIVVNEAKDRGIKIFFAEFAKYGIPVVAACYTVLMVWIAISSLWM